MKEQRRASGGKRWSGGGSRRQGGPSQPRPQAPPTTSNHVFDSRGPETRIRGTAQQLFESYDRLGMNAMRSGDRVSAQSFFQHAEHYLRIVGAVAAVDEQRRQAVRLQEPEPMRIQGDEGSTDAPD